MLLCNVQSSGNKNQNDVMVLRSYESQQWEVATQQVCSNAGTKSYRGCEIPIFGLLQSLVGEGHEQPGVI